MWLNSRSRSNGQTRTRLGGSLIGCDGTRSMMITILALLKHSGGDGQRRPSPMSKLRIKKKSPKRVLALPDLEQAKSAVLNTLTSVSGQRTYDHAINDFVEWNCSEPPLAFTCKRDITRHRLASRLCCRTCSSRNIMVRRSRRDHSDEM